MSFDPIQKQILKTNTRSFNFSKKIYLCTYLIVDYLKWNATHYEQSKGYFRILCGLFGSFASCQFNFIHLPGGRVHKRVNSCSGIQGSIHGSCLRSSLISKRALKLVKHYNSMSWPYYKNDSKERFFITFFFFEFCLKLETKGLILLFFDSRID